MKKPHRLQGLIPHFSRLVVVSALSCILLFFALQFMTKHALNYYFDTTNFRVRTITRCAENLQQYIDKNGLSVRDTDTLSDWVQQNGVTYLELYHDHRLYYTSLAPDMQDEDPGMQKTPFSEFLPHYDLQFSDGEAEAVLLKDNTNVYYVVANCAVLVFCIVVFLLCLMPFLRRIVRYIRTLSEEIQAMEGGDLDHPITVQGRTELTTLAECLDSMRVTLRDQQQQEAEASAKVKNLITEMSHDLRTPLTTLLLYTEIVRSGKYATEDQRDDYLNKIDAKARQIKQLSDNLFEYALVTRDTIVTLDPPAPFSQIFEGPLTEMMEQLQRGGLTCALELGTEDLLLTVKEQYIRRILDNITSNLIKYADPAQPVDVHFVREGESIGLAFANAVLPQLPAAESTKVGLTSIETMMEKMHAVSRVEQSEGRFCITLLFPLS